MPPLIMPRATHQNWTAGDRGGAVRLTVPHGHPRVQPAALPSDPRTPADAGLDRLRPARGV